MHENLKTKDDEKEDTMTLENIDLVIPGKKNKKLYFE